MWGEINGTVVKQFRMPGYPLVLVSTELLQEGEDLHTFCSSIFHYGISWTPSSMEQRIGRIDRVSSQTERRLTALRREETKSELLQVYYPHLRETVEVLQVRRVLERMRKFLLMMHRDLGMADAGGKIDVGEDMLRDLRAFAPITTPLTTAFPVEEAQCQGPVAALVATAEQANALEKRFRDIRQAIPPETVEWEQAITIRSHVGSLRVGSRTQPFFLHLRSFDGHPLVRCVSPIGKLRRDLGADLSALASHIAARVALVRDDRVESYDVTIEDDVLLGEESSDAERVKDLVLRTCHEADRLEEELLTRDQPLATFRKQLLAETTDG